MSWTYKQWKFNAFNTNNNSNYYYYCHHHCHRRPFYKPYCRQTTTTQKKKKKDRNEGKGRGAAGGRASDNAAFPARRYRSSLLLDVFLEHRILSLSLLFLLCQLHWYRHHAYYQRCWPSMAAAVAAEHDLDGGSSAAAVFALGRRYARAPTPEWQLQQWASGWCRRLTLLLGRGALRAGAAVGGGQTRPREKEERKWNFDVSHYMLELNKWDK